MGSTNSSSSTSSSSPPPQPTNDNNCYFRNRMMRQHSFQTQQPNLYPNSNRIQMRCDCQRTFVECDENGRVLKPNK